MAAVYLIWRGMHEDVRLISAHRTAVGADAAARALHTGQPSSDGRSVEKDACATWKPKSYPGGAYPSGAQYPAIIRCDGMVYSDQPCSVRIVAQPLKD
jgi:hypothetical protein